MINYSVFYIGLALMVCISLYLGWKGHHQKGEQNTNDFFLAGKQVGMWSLCLTLLATQVGGAALCGAADQAVEIGPFALSYSLGQALGFLILGLGLGGRMRMLRLSTTAEIFSSRYGSPALRKCTGLVSVLSLSGILGAMVVALRGFLHGIDIKEEWVVVCTWLVIVLYTVRGGLRGVILTDVFQMLFVIVVLCITLAFLYFRQPSLWSEAMAFYINQKGDSSLSLPAGIGGVLSPLLFMFVEQDMTQRFFAGKSNKKVSMACLLASILLVLIACIPVFFGMVARLKGKGTNCKDAFMYVLSEETGLVPPVIGALAALAVLAAILSTADSLLVAVSANICQDLLPSSQITFAQGVTAVLGVGALLASYLSKNIFGLLYSSYEISISCLLVPLLVALWDEQRKYTSRWGAYGAVVGGLVSFVFFQVFKETLEKYLFFPSIVVSLIVSSIGFFLLSLMQKKCAQE